jgi:LCP family protein required for cell wall assembly
VSDEPRPPAGPDAPKRRGEGRRKHTVGYVVLASLVVLALVTGLAVVFVYRHLNGNLTVADVTGQLEDRPDKVEVAGEQEPINILVMGSDDRDAEGNNIDGLTGQGERSDTTILMHLSADRERAYGISIPRDSIVDRPECDRGKIPAAQDVMWNEAFLVGGPACTIQQVEQLTGIYVDHYVVVDFAGFRDMVDAIDGVPVCIPEDIVDPAHGINIPAGEREIEGYEALNYVRARYTLGDGSDISRIKRQQAFMSSMAHKVISAGTLARLDRLVGFLDAATQSLTVDPGLENVAKIGHLGLQFRGIGLDKIQFLTVPNAYYPSDSEFSGRVFWKPAAKRLWKRIAEDEPLGRGLTGDAITAAKPPGSKDGSGKGSGDSGGGKPDDSSSPSEQEQDQAEANGLCA